MWSWDQGRLDYFQFDNLKKIARFGAKHDLRLADQPALSAATGLEYKPVDPRYPPWRNYGRSFKSALICAADGNGSRLTKVGALLASDGGITTDEYFHFLAEATTDPLPALRDWDHTAEMRYPLLFSLKFLLARAAMGIDTTSISEIVASYGASGFIGDEDQSGLARKKWRAPTEEPGGVLWETGTDRRRNFGVKRCGWH